MRLAEYQKQLTEREKQLAEREKQLAALARQAAEEQRHAHLPPIENGTVKIYRFMYANPREASKMIESLFGTLALRVAVDERSSTLLVYGKPDIITALDALLDRFDEQASPDGYQKSTQGMAAPRSLLLRVFWLADGLPKGEGQNPADFLPKSVLTATEKLGLEAPRLVTQTVNSLATGKEDSVDFSTNVPAVLLRQPVELGCQGKLKLAPDDRVRVEMGIRVGGPSVNCELRGSMATPLGHYMVLGTANSMIAEGSPMAAGAPDARGLVPGGVSEPGRPYRDLAARRGPGPEGGLGEAPAPPASPPEFATSRFAFVVQVIEGQSYAAEKANAESE
jgi:hypothetical protein